jgi:hypothetical protein
MNVVDTFVLALLALADMALMVHLRRTRGRRLRDERMLRSLRLALQRDADAQALAPAVKQWALRRAS